MNVSSKKSCATVLVVIIASVFLSGVIVYLLGCSKKGDSTWGSSYSVDYIIALLGGSSIVSLMEG